MQEGNKMTLNENQGKQVKRNELVDSFSRHAKLSNKYMFGILFCCIVFTMNLNHINEVEIPYIGEIPPDYFYLISITLISCLMILFSSSHLMAMRIREYYNNHFKGANNKDYFDLTVEPTIFRVAPISWMIKNKKVFYINIDENHKGWKRFEVFTYLVLKILVFIVVYLFPAVILIISLIKSRIFDFENSVNIILRVLLIVLTVLSLLSFVVVWKNSIIFTFRVPKNALKRD